jgi:hypothetical protein
VSRRTAAAVAVAAAVVGAGCTAGGDPGPGRPVPSPASSFVIPSPILSPRPFTVEDLPAVSLGRGDAPTGTEFAPQYSVDETIDQFASDAEELTALRVDGFVSGHVTLFVPPAQVADDTAPVEPGQVFVQEIAGLFETAPGADSSLRRYVSNLRAFDLRRDVRISATGLGASSEGLRGTIGGDAVTIYAWRTANLLLVVSGSGSIPSHDVRALADLMQRRADLAR